MNCDLSTFKVSELTKEQMIVFPGKSTTVCQFSATDMSPEDAPPYIHSDTVPCLCYRCFTVQHHTGSSLFKSVCLWSSHYS